MNAYPLVPLGEICTVNPRKKGAECSGEDMVVSFVPMSAVDERFGTIAVREERPLSDISKGFTAFENGDVLFAKITPCMENGKIALARNLVNGVGRGSTEFFVLRPGDRVLDEYVYHFIRQPRFREVARQNFTGTAGQQRVPKSFMENALVTLPPLSEQREIVGVLNRAARIEHLRTQATDRLRGIISALFIKMFGDKASGSQDWSLAALEQLLVSKRGSIRTGPFGSQLKHSEFTDQGVPVLGIDNVVTNQFRWDKLRYIPSEKCANFLRYRVFPGDVIVTIMGTTGRVCVAPDDLPECLSTKHLCVLTLDRSLVEPFFVWGALLFDDSVRAQTRVQGQGQIMEGWNMAIVKQLQLRIPPLDIQRLFARVVVRMMALERMISEFSNTASALKDSLMDSLFEERVRIEEEVA